MKLEIKHLAPYLPYGLHVWHRRHTYPRSTSETILTPTILCYVEVGGIHTIKPILRPLSQLTKEIEHDGKRFVPNQALLNWYGHGDRYYPGITFQNVFGADPIDAIYPVVQKLFEWHFDVFGLIEQGLAIEKLVENETGKE